MYLDYETFEELSQALSSLPGKEFSPGWVASVYGVSRQAVNKWINNDVIDAHRLRADDEFFLLIKESEFKKIDRFRSK